MFHDWWDLLKQVGITIYDVFHQSVGLGTSIVNTLTGMLKQLDAWLVSTSGASALHSIFAVHLQEVQALLALLGTLVSAFGQVYIAIGPALALVVTWTAQFVNWLLKIPGAGPILAIAAAVALLVNRMNLLAFEAGLVKVITGIYTAAVALPGAFLAWAASEDVAAASTVALGAATDATKASTTGVAAQFSSLLTPIGLATIGVEALVVGAALLVINWNNLTTALWSFQNPVLAAQKAIAALNAAAAKTVLSNLTNDTQGFTAAISTFNSSAIAPRLLSNLGAMVAQSQANATAIQNLKTATDNWTNSGNKFSNAMNGISTQTFAAAAAAKIWNATQTGTMQGLQGLIDNFSNLSPAMQGTINELSKYGATNQQVVQAYQAMITYGNQTIGNLTSIRGALSPTQLGYDNYLAALQKLAGETTGPLHLAYMGMIADLGSIGSAQTRLIQASLPQWNAEIAAYTNIATANGLSTAAALKWATAQATSVDPAGAAAYAQVVLYAASLHTTTANAEALIAANPGLLVAFENAQAAAANQAHELSILQGYYGGTTAKIWAMIRPSTRSPTHLRKHRGQGRTAAAVPSQRASTGARWMLHGTEAIVPKSHGVTALWSAIRAHWAATCSQQITWSRVAGRRLRPGWPRAVSSSTSAA